MHRFQELQEQLRKMEQQNQQFRHTMDQVLLQRNQPPPPQEEEPFKPEVSSALEKKIKKMLEPETARFKQTVGYLAEENDSLKFIQKFGYETAEKYGDKIKSVRDEANMMGKYLTREEAYQRVYFDENSKKAQPKPEAAKAPRFDPYLKAWTQETQPETPAAPQQEPQEPQAPQASAQVQPPPQESFALPPMGPVNTPTMAASPTKVTGLSLETDAKAMEAWEKKYGDVPL